MAGLDSIKGYAEGEEVVAPTSSGLSMKVTPKGTLVPAAKDIVADPVVTADLLKNMQAMIDAKSSPFRGFQDSLARASAWTVPSLGGQKANAINQTIAAQNLEDKELFDMKQQMASYKAAQSSAENDAARLASITGGVGGFAQNTPSAGGQEIPADVRARMDAQKTSSAKLAVYDEYLKGRITEGTKKELSPAMADIVDVFDPASGKMEQMTKAQAEKLLTAKPSLVVGPAIQPRQAPVAAGTGGINVANIQQVESGGNPNAVSPKGAMGVMQVMPNTQTNPGFGVAPAKDTSPAELQRVGEDYFRAMQKQYGHDTLAAVAYNMGPGATDAWIKKGARFSDLPKETQDYIGKVNLANAMQGRQQAPQPQTGASGVEAAPTQAPVAAVSRPTTKAEYQEAEALRKIAAEEKIKTESKGLASELEDTGKDIAARKAALIESNSNADTNIANVKYIRELTKANPNAFGVLQNPTIAAAVATALEGGVTAGVSGRVENIDDAVRKAMKGAKESDIVAAQKAANKFSELQLNAAKVVLKGQGAVSDNERRLVANMTGSTKNSREAIEDFMRWSELRSEYDKQIGAAQKNWERSNPGKSHREFELSNEHDLIKAAYVARINDFAETAGRYKASDSKAKEKAPHPGAALLDLYPPRKK